MIGRAHRRIAGGLVSLTRATRRRVRAGALLADPRLREGSVVSLAGGERVRARLDPRLDLPAVVDQTRGVVAGCLTAYGVDFWRVEDEAAGVTYAVAAADFAATARALAGSAALRGWYRDRIDATGRLTGHLEAATAPIRRRVPGLVLWEFIVASHDSGFAADHRQGVVLQFWTEDPAGSGRLAAPGRNGVLESVDRSEVRGLRGGLVPSAAQRSMTTVTFPVDVVYTWVDGADPNWLATKIAAAAGTSERLPTERAGDEARFADHDELRYSLRSLAQFAPWVNHVWIVTAGQYPSWLAEHPDITVVDHSVLFPTAADLPTFNSHAIEACLHRIPGLAEHFLYLNDDMIIGRAVAPELFFHGNGLGRFFWSKVLVDHRPPVAGEIASSVAAKNARRLISDRFGVGFSRKFFHAPYPLRVSVLNELERTFPEAVAGTRAATFRSTVDVAVAGSFALNYAYVTGRSVPSSIRYEYCDPADSVGIARMAQLLSGRDVDTFCLNDGHSDQTNEQRRVTAKRIRTFLQSYLPVPARWERQ